MDLTNRVILWSAIIALIAICTFTMLRSVMAASCEASTILPYSAVMRDFNGSFMTTDSGRYSAELLARSRINDSVVSKTSIPTSDPHYAASIGSIATLTKIDDRLPTMDDDVVYHIITTSSIDDNPEFVLMKSDPRYKTVVLDFDKVNKRFRKLAEPARSLAMAYSSSITTASTDETIYEVLING